ncbi:hypothetical protein [Anaerorudis cellulosivorans]|jgi:hypothetical protein|uniref:hypothetical protein n=1 Tax=Anaerorudis cellulosivorans TaxID=3397862 RepID=UPI00221F2E64|nr:hypothetical protein [Seramator thermalis]MCW1734243.1 hypothetical protein [Seramator thermalis]
MLRLIRSTTLILIFLSLSTSFETGIYYIFLGIIIILFFIYTLIIHKIQKITTTDLIALSFILIWAYGFILGLIKGNNTSYVISNFAGMTCYFIYFVLVRYKIDTQLLVKIILASGFLLGIFAFAFMISIASGNPIPLVDANISFSSTGQFRIYFPNLAIIYCLFGISFYQILYNKKDFQFMGLDKRIISFIYFMLSLITLFFLCASKGFALGIIYVIGIIVLFSYGSQVKRNKLHLSFFFFIFLIIILLSVIITSGYFNIITNMFKKEDISNIARYEQLNFLLADLKLFGNGLGATVPGYISNPELPYGFELTFVNVIHKFGIFSIILFFNWIYMFLYLFKQCWNKKNIIANVIMLSSLGYLFPSIGNPLLFHPSLAILNSIVLYHIKMEKNNAKKVSLHSNI